MFALFEGVGSGAVSTTYGDVVNADVVIITGSNPTANHPVASSFFKQARRRGTKIIYVDPRASTVAEHADLHVQLKPGTDVAFYNAVMHEVIRLGLIDREFIAERTSNYDELARTVADYPPERAAQITGVDADTIREVARLWGEAGAGVIYWGMGISQHTTGTDNARCLIALCSITGNVGRPGSGLHPLRGQNNVQGASDAGLIPMFYPDYQGVDRDATRERFEQAWGVPLDPKRGLTVTEIIKSVLQPGGVRGMYMLGENPFLSDPNINKVRKALSALEFLVVQDIFLTETAEFADVILPATSYLEKDGTYTNTDRRVQLGRKALDPPGQARPDWEIEQDLARRLGLDWDYGDPSEIFDEMVALMPSYKNLRYDNLGLSGKLYPNADPEHTDGTIVMFDERFNTDDGLAHLVPAQWLPPKELPDAEYPLVLNTGRLLEHWHTGSMTRRSFALDAISPVAEVYLHPKDAAERGLAHGQMARARSRRGAIELQVRISHREQLGNCFIPFHFREAAANLLTIDEIDPYGKIPEFKFCAVQVEACERGSRMTEVTDRAAQVARPAGARGRGPGREVPRALADPGAERDPGPAGLAAPRGAGGAGPRRPPAALRDRGPDLVLPALPDRAAAEGGAARLPRPALFPARRRGPDGRAARALRRGRRCRAGRGVLPGPLRHRPAVAVNERPAPVARCGVARRRGPGPATGRRAGGRADRAVAQRSLPGRHRGRRALHHAARAAGRRARRGQDDRDPEGLRAARHGRGRLPDRAEVGAGPGHPARGAPSTRSATPTSPSRARSRTARSWPPSRTWCWRGCCWAWPWSAPSRAGSSSGTSTARRSTCCGPSWTSCARPGWSGRTPAAAGAGWRSRSSSPPAATSSARRPRCWSAWRATAASRATSRPSPATTACTAGRR